MPTENRGGEEAAYLGGGPDTHSTSSDAEDSSSIQGIANIDQPAPSACLLEQPLPHRRFTPQLICY